MNQPPTAFDPKQAKVIHQWKGPSPLIACCFDPHDKFVVAAAENRQVLRWTIPDGKLDAWDGHESWPRCLAASSTRPIVVSGGSDDLLIWWDTDSSPAKPIRKLEAHKGWIRSVAVSSDGNLLASAGNDGRVRLWELESAKPLAEWGDHEREIYSVQFHPDGKSIFSGDLMGNVIRRALPSGQILQKFAAKELHSYNAGQRVDFGGVRDIAVRPDGKRIAASGLFKASNPLGAVHQPLVLLFDLEPKKQAEPKTSEAPKKDAKAQQDTKPAQKQEPAVAGKHFSDLKGIASRVVYVSNDWLVGVTGGTSGGYLLFWQPGTEKPAVQFKLPDIARGMDVDSTGRLFATAHYDRHVRITRV